MLIKEKRTVSHGEPEAYLQLRSRPLGVKAVVCRKRCWNVRCKPPFSGPSPSSSRAAWLTSPAPLSRCPPLPLLLPTSPQHLLESFAYQLSAQFAF